MCECVVVPMQRVMAVVSQVVHFLSDLLASGTALLGDKDAPPLPLGYSSTVLTRFLRAFSAAAANKSSHTTTFKLALSPHYALSDSSSPSAHASTSTVLGTAKSLTHCSLAHAHRRLGRKQVFCSADSFRTSVPSRTRSSSATRFNYCSASLPPR